MKLTQFLEKNMLNEMPALELRDGKLVDMGIESVGNNDLLQWEVFYRFVEKKQKIIAMVKGYQYSFYYKHLSFISKKLSGDWLHELSKRIDKDKLYQKKKEVNNEKKNVNIYIDDGLDKKLRKIREPKMYLSREEIS